MSTADIDACDTLVVELARRFRAHLNRRQQVARRGHIDLRRTIRQSISKGGALIVPVLRERQPGRLNLVVLCDHSYSVSTASRFLISLLLPARRYFRRTRIFGFVDQPVEVSFENATLVPHERLDLYARSDFGRVLVTFWGRYEALLTRNTLLLVLGDARNNRRPPRADLLARARAIVRQVIWLNPEVPSRWNSGDSVMATYARHCDSVFAASTLGELLRALRGIRFVV